MRNGYKSMNNMYYKGYLIIENLRLTETKLQKRIWRERLFSKPWSPRTKYKNVYAGPGRAIMDELNKAIYMSPELLDQFKKKLRERGEL